MNIWRRSLKDDIQLVGVRGRLDQHLNPELDAELDELADDGSDDEDVDGDERPA